MSAAPSTPPGSPFNGGSWAPFLPRHSVVMRVRAQAPSAAPPSSTPSAPTIRLIFVATLLPAELELLERMIGAMGLPREAVLVCGDADLGAALATQRPEFVIALSTPEALRGSRGEWTPLKENPEGASANRLTTWHPAHLLRTPAAKKEAWQDLQRVARALGTLA